MMKVVEVEPMAPASGNGWTSLPEVNFSDPNNPYSLGGVNEPVRRPRLSAGSVQSRPGLQLIRHRTKASFRYSRIRASVRAASAALAMKARAISVRQR